ncbi:MAG: cysteine rich repeat-containing protein [Phreatobacter sp.]
MTAALLVSGTPALAQAREARQACGSDVQRLCAGTAPGGGRILQCLKARTADLSPTCRSFLERMR